MSQLKIWVFQGEQTSHASAIYADFQAATQWIEALKLSGVLTEYPFDQGVYDWAVARRHFTAKPDIEPSFIGSFTSASQRHVHFDKGRPDEPLLDVGKPRVFSTRVWVFTADRARFPGGIFSTSDRALEWARSHRLTGTIQPYPLNMSLFDWIRRRMPKDQRPRRQAEIVANYWTSTPEDIRVVDGRPFPGSRSLEPQEPPAPSRVSIPVLITPADINLWASRTESRSQLPVLVMRLIMGSRNRISRLDFPGGESIDRRGWDGIVSAEGDDPFVPRATSGWEISVESGVVRKLDRDYNKRVSDPQGLDPKTSTLVFVSAHRSAAARAWARDRAREGIWADVRVYTADELATWINAVPPVAMWFAGLIGKIPPGVATLDSWWKDWSLVTAPRTSPDLVLAGLAEATSTLQQWIKAPAALLVVRSATRDEAIAILAAAAIQGDVDESVLGRTWIADDPDTFASLATASTPLVLIANFEDRSRVSAAVSNGHHVYVPSDEDDPTTPAGLEIARRDRQAVESALQQMGLDPERSVSLAETGRLSIPALRRRLAAMTVVATPAWARPEEATGLLGPLLLGSWDEARDADRKAVEAVTGLTYQAVDATMRRWASAPDSPIALVATVWRFVDPVDAWMLLHRYVGTVLLDRFVAAAVDVLSESDPRYDLPPDEQYAAAVYGKTLEHSERIRRAIGSMLALMAALSGSHPIPGARSGQDVANQVVNQLLTNADSRRWASLTSLLPLLAEAAPDVFLRNVDAALTRADVIPNLFIDSSVTRTVSSPHTGLLWALEVLAWPSEYLSESVDILARLAQADPGGRLSNRPAGSISEILKVWHPSTCAKLVDRLTVARRIAERFPQIAWSTLGATLPIRMGVAHGTAHAQWRDWRCPTSATYSDIYLAVTETIDILLTLVDLDAHRWLDLLQLVDDLSENDRKRILTALEDGAHQLQAEDKATIWNALRGLAERHRAFPDAKWALPASAVAEIDRVAEAMMPSDIVLSSEWLFTDHPELPNFQHMPWDQLVADARRRRLDVVRQIYANGGLDATMTLARRVDAPWTVGEALANVAPLAQMRPLLEAQIDADEPRTLSFARGVIYELARSKPSSLEEVLDHPISTATRAELLAAMPFGEQTWSRVRLEDERVQAEYWARLQLYGRGRVEPPDLAYVADELLRFGLMVKAIDFVHLYSEAASADLIVRVLRAPLVAGAGSVPDLGRLATDIPRLLAQLRVANVNVETLAELEWQYLPLLHEPLYEPYALVDKLQRDPAFFVEVLTLVYRARTGEETTSPSEQAKALAQRAFTLLYGWKRPPGVTDGQIDGARLREWVDGARALAAEVRRQEVADVHIGQVLAYLPSDAEGLWPPSLLGSLLEDYRSNEIESGLVTGVLNKRGIVTKSVSEGGKQEWDLSDQFAERASALAPRFPRLARTLRRIAESYEGLAKREDAEAELGT